MTADSTVVRAAEMGGQNLGHVRATDETGIAMGTGCQARIMARITMRRVPKVCPYRGVG